MMCQAGGQATVASTRNALVGAEMTTLLVGFDSAWTANNSGALVGALRWDSGALDELGPPMVVNYADAERVVKGWQDQFKPTATVQLLDQPTIVNNATGQRPVENIVGSSVGRRYGGMQLASMARTEMFGEEAPVWQYLDQFGGPANPMDGCGVTGVIETYPVLAMIALRWTLPDPDGRPAGRLPKYNPRLKKKFSIDDWQHVCGSVLSEFSERRLGGTAQWIEDLRRKVEPRKCDQDGLDACICLLVALYLAEGKECLMVGNTETGYIVVPHDAKQEKELEERCAQTGRDSARWVRTFQW
jgi:predicted RNase H-like nuclease